MNEWICRICIFTRIHGWSNTSSIVSRLCGFGASIFNTKSLAFDDIDFHSGASSYLTTIKKIILFGSCATNNEHCRKEQMREYFLVPQTVYGNKGQSTSARIKRMIKWFAMINDYWLLDLCAVNEWFKWVAFLHSWVWKSSHFTVAAVNCPLFTFQEINCKHTTTRPRLMISCRRFPEPRNGKRPDKRTCSITPAPQMSHPFPYIRLDTTSGAIYCGHPMRPSEHITIGDKEKWVMRFVMGFISVNGQCGNCCVSIKSRCVAWILFCRQSAESRLGFFHCSRS